MSEAAVALLALLAAPALWSLMWLGWRSRGRRQAGVAPPPAVPANVVGNLLEDVEATYLATTSAGRWLDRLVAHGLGVRSLASVRVSTGGALISRVGAPDVWIPAAAFDGARLDRGIAGKVVPKEGLVVVTWRLGDTLVDTGLLLRHGADRGRLLDALGALAPGTPRHAGSTRPAGPPRARQARTTREDGGPR